MIYFDFLLKWNAEAHAESKCRSGKIGGVAIEVDLPSLILHSFEPSVDGTAMVLKVMASLIDLTKTLNKLELELCQARAWLIVWLSLSSFLLEIQN